MKKRQIAVLVDAGYFFAQASEAIFGFIRSRSELELHEQKSLDVIREKALAAFPGQDILRVYWYDAPPSRTERMSASQERMGMMAGVKLRLGALNGAGQQKGVDALLCRDLEELARNHAVESVLLVSGDEDLRLAMEQAQNQGVRVSLLAVGPGHASISMALMMESDGLERLEREDIFTFLSARSVRLSEPSAPRSRHPASRAAHKKAGSRLNSKGTGHNGSSHKGSSYNESEPSSAVQNEAEHGDYHNKSSTSRITNTRVKKQIPEPQKAEPYAMEVPSRMKTGNSDGPQQGVNAKKKEAMTQRRRYKNMNKNDHLDQGLREDLTATIKPNLPSSTPPSPQEVSFFSIASVKPVNPPQVFSLEPEVKTIRTPRKVVERKVAQVAVVKEAHPKAKARAKPCVVKAIKGS